MERPDKKDEKYMKGGVFYYTGSYGLDLEKYADELEIKDDDLKCNFKNDIEEYEEMFEAKNKELDAQNLRITRLLKQTTNIEYSANKAIDVKDQEIERLSDELDRKNKSLSEWVAKEEEFQMSETAYPNERASDFETELNRLDDWMNENSSTQFSIKDLGYLNEWFKDWQPAQKMMSENDIEKLLSCELEESDFDLQEDLNLIDRICKILADKLPKKEDSKLMEIHEFERKGWKEKALNLEKGIRLLLECKIDDWLKRTDNCELFAQAWLNGYTVEEPKEKLYSFMYEGLYLYEDGKGKFLFKLKDNTSPTTAYEREIEEHVRKPFEKQGYIFEKLKLIEVEDE